jgi:hypothetical protein
MSSANTRNNTTSSIRETEYLKAAEVGVRAFAEGKGLCLSTIPRKRTGDAELSQQTERSYNKHYDGLYRFAAMIRSFETCLVLSVYAPPDFCPSMDDDVVALYIKYKTQAKGEKLLRKDQADREVLDILGKPVVCTGAWKDLGNIEQFLSAMTRMLQKRQVEL